MRYAIGEIVLVVIGILIALSINNWNEGQKLESLELNLLSEIRNGLNVDLKEANNAILAHKGFIKSQQIAVDWLQNDLPFQDSLATHFLRTFFHHDFITNEAPYETLKLVGLEIIKNDTLKDRISNMYGIRYETLRRRNEEQLAMKSNYKILLGDNRFSYVKEPEIDITTVWDGFKPLDVPTLKSDDTFLFNLKFLMGGLLVYNYELEELKLEIERLITMINLELERRN